MKKREKAKGFTPFMKMGLAGSLIFIGLFLFIFRHELFLYKTGEGRPTEVTVQSELNALRDDLETRYLTPIIGHLDSLFLNHQENAFPEQSKFETFVKSNPSIIALSLWKKEDRWPIRIVKPGFWSQPEIRRISETERSLLLDFIFPQSTERSFNSIVEVKRILPYAILNKPVIALSSRVPSHTIYRSWELTLDIGDFIRHLDGFQTEASAWGVCDSSGAILMETVEDQIMLHEVPADTVLAPEGKTIIRAFFSSLPWSLYMIADPPISRPESTVAFGGSSKHLRLFLIGWLMMLILAWILSRWIERPWIEFADKATLIAGGNFQFKFPKTRIRSLDKLGGIFSYMADEMERLTQVDVNELISEKNKTEAVIHNIADGVIVTDAFNTVTVMNLSAQKWFGVRPGEVLHKPISEALKNEALCELIVRVQEGSPDNTETFSMHVMGQSDPCTFLAHASRIASVQDTSRGVVTTIRDITTESETDQMKTELVSMVAHELKSPLTSIFGFSELLLDTSLDDQSREYAQIILNESTRLTNLVNKFLDLSKLEAGKTEIRMCPFDLKQIIDKIIKVYRNQADKKQIRIMSDISKGLPLAYGDPQLIEQVVLNLYTNAVKYSPNNSKIGFEITEEGEDLVVSVIDNGYGIPNESLPKIFSKFYRVSDSKDFENSEGSGLGLALAKEIVEQHHGTIRVNSRLGVGSVFSFTIPKANII